MGPFLLYCFICFCIVQTSVAAKTRKGRDTPAPKVSPIIVTPSSVTSTEQGVSITQSFPLAVETQQSENIGLAQPRSQPKPKPKPKAKAKPNHEKADSIAREEERKGTQTSSVRKRKRDDPTEEEPSEKKATKEKRTFSQAWLKKYSFLRFDVEQNLMFCRICELTCPSKCGPWIEGSNNFRDQVFEIQRLL